MFLWLGRRFSYANVVGVPFGAVLNGATGSTGAGKGGAYLALIALATGPVSGYGKWVVIAP